MGKRVGIFTIIILTIIPVLAVGITMGGLFLQGQGWAEEAYEAFSRQDTQNTNVLLADEGGNAFLVCSLEKGNTRLISILPTACPKGEEGTTFLSVYREKGIQGLKEKIEKSLSCGIVGYLKVDFSGLAPMVDALGGVKIDGNSFSGVELENYLQGLNGDRNGAYAQQNVVLAVGRQFCGAGFWKGQNALRKLLKVTDTDLSLTTLMKIGKDLIPALEGKGLHQYCLPEGDKWKIPQNPGMTGSVFSPAKG